MPKHSSLKSLSLLNADLFELIFSFCVLDYYDLPPLERTCKSFYSTINSPVLSRNFWAKFLLLHNHISTFDNKNNSNNNKPMMGGNKPITPQEIKKRAKAEFLSYPAISRKQAVEHCKNKNIDVIKITVQGAVGVGKSSLTVMFVQQLFVRFL